MKKNKLIDLDSKYNNDYVNNLLNPYTDTSFIELKEYFDYKVDKLAQEAKSSNKKSKRNI